ncbi:MAG: hypothetical protein V4701_11760 [Pseudomonadota bacterium]
MGPPILEWVQTRFERDQHAAGLGPIGRQKATLQNLQAVVDGVMGSVDQRRDLLGTQTAAGAAKDRTIER